MEWDYGQLIAPTVTAIIGVVTIIILSIQFYFSRKQHRVQGLLEAFKILDNDGHRTYRKKVFEAHFKYDNSGDVEIFRHPDYKDAMQLPMLWQILI